MKGWGALSPEAEAVRGAWRPWPSIRVKQMDIVHGNGQTDLFHFETNLRR